MTPPLISSQPNPLQSISIKYDGNVIRSYDLKIIGNIVKQTVFLNEVTQKSSGSTLGITKFDSVATTSENYSKNVGQGVLIERVTSAIGGVTKVVYGESTDTDFVTDDEIRGTRMLVRSIEQFDGRGGNPRLVTYAYEGGEYSTPRERSLGFAKVTATLPTIGNESVQPVIVGEYRNAFYAQNSLPRLWSYYVNGALARRIDYDYSDVLSGNGPWRSNLSQVKYESWENGLYLQSSSSYAMTSYGEPSEVRYLGYTLDHGQTDLDESDNLVTAISYNIDTAKYIVNTPSLVQYIAAREVTPDLSKRLQAFRFDYDAIGNMTGVREWGSSGYRQAATFSYDARGNVLQEQGPRTGQTTTHTYGGPNSLFLTGTTNAKGQTQAWGWDFACQKPLWARDVNNLATNFEYDVHCRETKRTLPSGHAIETAYREFGDPSNQYTQVKEDSAAEGTLVDATRSYFDGLGQVYKTARSGTTSTDAALITTLSYYDRRGNLHWQSLPVLGLNPDPDVPSNKRVTYSHDGLNRPVRTTFADGSYETLAYEVMEQPIPNGTLIRQATIRSKNPDCYATSPATTCREGLQVTGGRGWIVRTGLYDRQETDTDVSGVHRYTGFTRDPLGRLIGARDPRGSVWSYAYDAFGDRIESVDPDLGKWTMAYDASGNLITQLDAKGQTTSFTYDVLDRPTGKVAGGATTTYVYDEDRVGYHNIGQLTTASNSAESIAYNYSKIGDLRKETHSVDGRSYSIETGYHAGGMPTSLTLPSNAAGTANASVGSYRYDAANRQIGFGDLVTAITYDPWDNPVSLSFSNGTVETRSYSATRGWLTEVQVRKGSDLRLNTQLTRAASGLITQTYTLSTFGRFAYTYDYAGRLLSSTNFGGRSDFDQTFAYGGAGQMRRKTGIGDYAYPTPTLVPNPGSTHPHAPDRIIVGGATTATFAYDANGNMTTGLGKTMTYDAENRVKTATRGSATTTYVYGADGARLKRTVGGATTLTIGPIEVRNFKAASGEMLLLYPNSMVRLEGGTAAFFHQDQVDSIQLITDAAGTVAATSTCQPFGEKRTDSAGILATETRGFVGERYDSSSEL